MKAKRSFPKWPILFISVLSFALFSTFSFGATVNVPGDQPTIQAGIDAASDGDTILVSPGTYVENINFNGKNVILGSLFLSTDDSTYISQTIIDGSDLDATVRIQGGEDNSAKLVGMSITNGKRGIEIIGASPTIMNCKIYDNTMPGDNSGGGIWVHNSTAHIEKCEIFSNYARSGGGIAISAYNGEVADCYIHSNTNFDGPGNQVSFRSGTAIMKKCIIKDSFDCVSSTIDFAEGSTAILENILILSDNQIGDQGVFYSWYNSNPKLINITVVNTGASAGPLLTLGTSANFTISNSIASGFSLISGEGISARYSRFDNLVTGPGNINSNPQFVDTENENYRLQADSPCIDSGTTEGAPSTDIDGIARPQGAGYDMGVYERVGATIRIPSDYPTIQAAINTASDGDTVLVSPGTYIENINFNGKEIILGSLFLTTGEKSYVSQTIIDGNANGTPVVRFESGETENAKLVGFTIQNGFTATKEQGAGINITGGSAPTLEQLVIQNNISQSGRGGGIRCYYAGIPTIRNATIRNNTCNDMGGGIYSFASAINLIDSNISYNSAPSGSAISFHGNQSGNSGGIIVNCLMSNNMGIGVLNGSNIELMNCTIIDSSGGMGLWGESKIINSIVWIGERIYLGGILTVSHSCIRGGKSGIDYPFESALIWQDSNIEAEPLFVDPENANYYLRAGSPCIDKGTETDAPKEDIDGSPRPQGAGYDMGAYEYIPTLSDGLIAYYPFDGNANDESGNGNHGIVNGARLTVDRFGNSNHAYAFDGNAYIMVPNSPTIQSPFEQYSIAVWANTSGWHNGLSSLVCKGVRTAQYRPQFSSDGRFLFQERVDVYTDFHANLNTWYFFVTIWNNGNAKVYVNGSKIGEANTGSSVINNEQLEIGRDQPGALEYMIGSIDDIRIYNRCLSEAEIKELYNSSKPNAVTVAADKLSPTSATLNGTVNHNGSSTTVTFEYGPTISYNSTITATQSPLTGTTAQSVSASLTGLTPVTTYHFRVKATNSVGTSYGTDVTFTTPFSSILYVNRYDGTCGGNSPCYTTIQNAIKAASTGAAIRISHGAYSGSIVLDDSRILTLQGGWDATFSDQTPRTTVIKAPKANQGTLKVQEVVIWP
jgi:hypothetical protein